MHFCSSKFIVKLKCNVPHFKTIQSEYEFRVRCQTWQEQNLALGEHIGPLHDLFNDICDSNCNCINKPTCRKLRCNITTLVVLCWRRQFGAAKRG